MQIEQLVLQFALAHPQHGEPDEESDDDKDRRQPMRHPSRQGIDRRGPHAAVQGGSPGHRLRPPSARRGWLRSFSRVWPARLALVER